MPQTSTIATRARVADYPAATHHYESLYSFKGSPDGAEPLAGLTALRGALYGTTAGGGGYDNPGTVFRITKAGKERELFSFGSGSEAGNNPSSELLTHNGKLFGVAAGGRVNDLGVVYRVTTSGQESALYSFKHERGGYTPVGNLTAVNGKLYGLTVTGGSGHCSNGRHPLGCGTVFEVSTSGKKRVVYSFQGGDDGQFPGGNLVYINGTLYGTTPYGGDGEECSGRGCGTVFSVTTSGMESVLYRFKGPPYDAEYPDGLVALNNVLYGTGGGGTSVLGTVFSVSLSGNETILHNFTGGSDGENPSAGLEVVNGLLYGTTQGVGNDRGSCSGGRCGTVFKISASGTEQVLHRFRGYPGDGNDPNGYLTILDGKLYGTTYGDGSQGEGTVFRISP